MNKEVLRSYTNSDGMEIEVGKDHLDTAIELKLQQQEASPGRRCNWKLHKKMMEKQGFFDSDINENYRVLVKSYQEKVGLLTTAQKHAELVTDGKLEAVQEILGDIYVGKREASVAFAQLNKLKRNWMLDVEIVKEFRNALIDNTHIEIPHYAYQPRLTVEENKAVAVLTDWHIGVIVDDVYGNSFNLEIAKKRLEKLKGEILYYCKTFKVNDLTIIFNGDGIEHVFMRKVNQAKEVELNKSQQLVAFNRLLFDFVVSMSEYLNVEVGAIGGNHDRENGTKEDNIDDDSIMFVVASNIRDTIEIAKIPRIKFLDNLSNPSYIIKEFNGSNIKFIHGDDERFANPKKIEEHESLDKIEYKAIVFGHYHQYRVFERNYGKLEMFFGSLMGRNNYSVRKFKGATNASQGLIIVRDNGELVPIRIDLQIN